MSTLFIDAETYSELDVTEVGAHIYAAHPSTKVIFWSVRDPEWPASLVFEEPNIWHLLKLLKDSKRITWTKNEPLDLVSWGAFDRIIAEHTPLIANVKDTGWSDLEDGFIAGPNNTNWGDLMEVSLIYGGPAELEHAALWWTPVSEFKGKIQGKRLIKHFCRPDPTTGKRITEDDDPVKWAEFRAYASRDTEVMVPILDTLAEYSEMGEELASHWGALRVVGRMNERGVPIDRQSASRAKEILTVKERFARDPVETKYGFTPTQIQKVREFLGTEDCKRETLEDLLDDPNLDESKREVATARLLVSGAARKKLTPMLSRSTDEYPSVRDVFVYHGAWTRRLTSRGIQGQNFVRSKSREDFFDLLNTPGIEHGDEFFAQVRSNIRGFIQAPEGKTLCASDYSSVELRVGAWLANEQSLLDDFVAGEDPYMKMASKLYRSNVTDKEDPRRQVGKTVELAAIYQLSGRGLAHQAISRKIDLTETLTRGMVKLNNLTIARRVRDGKLKAEEADLESQVLAGDEIISVYRDNRPNIVESWKKCQKAFKDLIDADPGTYITWGRVTFERWADFIKVIRPSGFAQYYWAPKKSLGVWPNGKRKVNLNFVGRLKSGAMGWKSTYGGDIYQSLCQGTAADLILHGMETVEANGFLPVMSIHDEVVTLIDETDEDRSKELSELLCQLPEWAETLPIKASGWQQKRFTK